MVSGKRVIVEDQVLKSVLHTILKTFFHSTTWLITFLSSVPEQPTRQLLKPFPGYEWCWMRVKESLVIKGVIAIVIFKITLPPLHFTFFFLKEILMKNSHHWNQKDCFYHCNYNNINYAVYYYIKCRGFLLQVNTIKWNVHQHVKSQLFIFQKDSPTQKGLTAAFL